MRRYAFRAPSGALVAAACSIDTVLSRIARRAAPLLRTRAGSIVQGLKRLVLVGLWFGLSLSARGALASVPPVADQQSVFVPFNGSAPFVLSGSDSNPGGPYALSYTLTSAPVHGTLSGTAPNLTYTANSGYSGSDNIQYTVSDVNGTSDPATVYITVLMPPVASSQSVDVLFNTATAVFLSGIDNNPIPPGPLTFTVTTQPAHGVLSGTGQSLTYTPTTGYIGMDGFTFTVSDSNGTSDPATVALNVEPPPSTSTAVAAFPAVAAVRQNVQFDALVTVNNGSVPSINGTVRFCDGYNAGAGTCVVTLCAAAALNPVGSAAAATCVAPLQTLGTHTITALFSGDGSQGLPPSNGSADVSVSASVTPTSSTLLATPSYIALGESANLVATVSGSSAPGGSVSFCDGGSVFDANFCDSGVLLCGNVTLSATAPFIATCSAASYVPHAHTITTQYAGDAHTTASRGNTLVTVAYYGAVSGGISGLAGNGLVLHLNFSGGKDPGGDYDLPIPAGSTRFMFDDDVLDGDSYTVTVGTQPSGQTCSVNNGQGTMPSGDVTNVSVTCAGGSLAAIDIAHSPGYAAIGQTVNYVITIANPDASSHTASVNVTLPTQLANIQWNCLALGGSLCGVSSGTGSSIVQNVSLPAGASVLFFVTATLAQDDANGAITAAVTVTPNTGLPANASDELTVVVFRNGFE